MSLGLVSALNIPASAFQYPVPNDAGSDDSAISAFLSQIGISIVQRINPIQSRAAQDITTDADWFYFKRA
jgi:hypothetical protein